MRTLELLPILLLAISSNGDNVAVGLTYGFARIKVPFASNLLIAGVTGIGTLASMWIGQAIGSNMDPKLAGAVGGSIIAVIGGWVILQSIRSATHDATGSAFPEQPSLLQKPRMLRSLFRTLENPLGADRNFSRQIELKESWALAIALSLNNVANGIAAGMLKMNPVFTTLFVMTLSVLTLLGGLAAGYQFGKRSLGSMSGVVSGLLLVVLGLYEIHI
jgi:putative sporulation protein YtaF